MTVSDLIKDASLKAITLPSPDRDIKGVYIGDLLSWVMGRAEADSAWITIMSNINVIAVATLADVSCVILAEGVEPDRELIMTAEAKGVNLIASPLAAYETAMTLSRYLL
jgi:serine kinase of HPr protein (carbohydrate metabolism regulator)